MPAARPVRPTAESATSASPDAPTRPASYAAARSRTDAAHRAFPETTAAAPAPVCRDGHRARTGRLHHDRKVGLNWRVERGHRHRLGPGTRPTRPAPDLGALCRGICSGLRGAGAGLPPPPPPPPAGPLGRRLRLQKIGRSEVDDGRRINPVRRAPTCRPRAPRAATAPRATRARAPNAWPSFWRRPSSSTAVCPSQPTATRRVQPSGYSPGALPPAEPAIPRRPRPEADDRRARRCGDSASTRCDCQRGATYSVT